MRLKILVIILVIILQILLSGCIKKVDNSNNNEIPDGKTEDLNMTISTNNYTYSINSKIIIISTQIKNIASHPIQIYDSYQYNISISITSPNNQTWKTNYIYGYYHADIIPKKIKLKSNEKVNFDINIVDWSPSTIDWNITGKYILRGNYDNIVYSNYLEINLIYV